MNLAAPPVNSSVEPSVEPRLVRSRRGLVIQVNDCCPYCGSTHRQVKNGVTRGQALKKCQDCGRVYPVEKRQRGYSPETRLEAIRLYVDGINIRRIGRILSVNHQSVANWIKAHHQALQETITNFPNANPTPAADVTQVLDEQTGTHSLSVIEGDELFTFIGSKKVAPTC